MNRVDAHERYESSLDKRAAGIVGRISLEVVQECEHWAADEKDFDALLDRVAKQLAERREWP